MHSLTEPSSSVNPPQPFFELQGGRLSYRKPTGLAGRRGGGTRGKVKPYLTGGSRLRLMKTFAHVDFDALGILSMPLLFVTLTTTPELWGKDLEVYQALVKLKERIEYHYGSGIRRYTDEAGVVHECDTGQGGYVGAIVRKERGEKNGMLHYHLVLIGCPFIDQGWLRTAWTECCGVEGPLRVSVERPEDPKRVERYLSKYCAKVGYEGKENVAERPQSLCAQHPEGEAGFEAANTVTLSDAHNSGNGCTGRRHWYVWGKKSLPWAELQGNIGEGEAARLMSAHIRRAFRNVIRARVRVLGDRLGREKRSRMLAFVHRLKFNAGFTMLYNPSDLQRLLDWSAELSFDSS